MPLSSLSSMGIVIDREVAGGTVHMEEAGSSLKGVRMKAMAASSRMGKTAAFCTQLNRAS